MQELERSKRRYELAQLALQYDGPRLDLDLVRARDAIQRSQAEERFHPMTYYMRALGYDGVLHASWQQFNSGDIGNIWYPDVSSAN